MSGPKKIVGATYRVIQDGLNFINKGELVKLVYDDGSDCPLFQHPNFTYTMEIEGVIYYNSHYVSMFRLELVENQEVIRQSIDIHKQNNVGGNNGKCVACGKTLTTWGGGMGYYCIDCEE